MQPNILFILTDDQPGYMLEPMPQTRARIRDVGSDFVNGHADIPLCGPARCTVLTGMSVTSHGINVNGGTWEKFKLANYIERSIPAYLKPAGYVNGHFGKFINGHAGDKGHVPAYFDRWVEPYGDSGPGGEANVDGSTVSVQSNTLPSIWASWKLNEFIRNNAGRPWYAQFNPTIPHEPWTPSNDAEHRYDGDRRNTDSVNEADMSDKPYWMQQLDPATGIQQSFEGQKEELYDLDQKAIRNILDTLAETGQLGNTIIVYTSDNGYLHGEHRLTKKDRAYKESAEVPYFVKGPGVAQSNRQALVSHADIMPSILDFAGVPVPWDSVDGRSFATDIANGGFTNWRKRMLVSGSDALGPNNPGGANSPSGRWDMLVQNEWRFILHENGAKELYNMNVDKDQNRSVHNDVAASFIDDLKSKLWALRNSSGSERRALEVA